MFAISFVIFVYEAFSLVLPLRLRAVWQVAALGLLLFASFKNAIFQKIGGGMFFAPNLPYGAVLTGALLYNMLVLALFLLVFKDALWLLWKISPVKRPFPSGAASWTVLVVSAVLTLYGTWEAVRVPDVVTEDVFIPGLPQEFDGTRAALLVDLHASALNRRPFIEAIVKKTLALSPDVILLPGDFVDGLLQDRRDDLEPLSRLSAPLGVWGTSGNHEYYSGYEAWTIELERLGVSMLENRHAVLVSGDARLVIAGVPDPQGMSFGFAAPELEKALQNAPEDAPVILLDHRPEAARENARAGVALQLSGHTHGGMMPVLDWIVARFNGGFVRGWYDVGPMKLYVSRGTSLWNGFPMRLLDPAEITLFTLRKK